MLGCAAVAAQSISFTCVGGTHPQDAAYRAFMFPFPLGVVAGSSHLSCLIGASHGLKGGISNPAMLKRDPRASLYMNNPCVFRVAGNKRRLCLNVCPIKHFGGIKGCLLKCPNVKQVVKKIT